MNTFAVMLICIQIYLVQTVLSQCSLGVAAPAPTSTPILGCGGSASGALASGLGYSTAAAGLGAYGSIGNAATLGYGAATVAAYGGAGEGNVAVAGELPVAGNAAVLGQIPVLGAVAFNGNVPAAGSVSISGKCNCGCDSLY